MRLRQPVCHVHLTVQRRGEVEVLLRLLAIAGAEIQFPEPEVAVGNERSHTSRLGERKRLAVQTFSILGASCDGDVTVEAEGMGLASPGSESARERDGLSGVVCRLVDPTG